MLFVVLTILSVVCASVPILGFLFLLWWLDRHDREPLWLFLLTFAWGAIGAVLLAMIGSSLAMAPLGALIGPEAADRWSAVLIAPLVEEPTKALILFAVALSRHFDNASDGFVYGAAAGLGFGMTENFLYFTSVAATGDLAGWVQVVVVRTLFSAVMHACATACVGAMLGFARFRGWHWKLAALPVGFGTAIGIHALWNGLLTLDEISGSSTWSTWNFVVFPIEALVLFVVFQLSLLEERAILRRELADEVHQGLLPAEHAVAMGNWLRRARADWVPPGVPHRSYVRAATTLAIRKHQCRYASRSAYAFYADDVMRLRHEVKALLALGDLRRAAPKTAAPVPER